MKGLSVKVKIIFTFVGLISLTILGLFAYHTYEKYEDAEKILLQQNRYFVASHLPAVADLLGSPDPDALKEFIKYIQRQREDIEFIVITDKNRNILGSTAKAISLGNIMHIFTGNTGEVMREVSVEGKEILVVSLPVGIHGKLTVGFKAPTIQQMLKDEIKDALFVVPGFLAIGLLLGLFVSMRIVRPLKNLMEGINTIAKGELREVKVESSDEFGQIAEVFNSTINRLRGYIMTEEQRKQMEQNFIKFLEVISAAAEGDFTHKLPVTADMFGSLTDAFNLMVEDLSRLMREVKETAEGVTDQTESLLNTLQRMTEGAERQILQMKNASAAMDDTVIATAEISTKAEEATETATEATTAAQHGGTLVNRAIEEINLIRTVVQKINKKMKTLAERIIEIGTISGLIGEIASRTNLLAMNASIEAARAGEAGKGFVVIAEEIRALADRSAEASKQIVSIIKAIQTEAGEITSALEEETQIVEEASNVADDTGHAFRQIQDSINGVTQRIKDIHSATQKQRELTSNMVIAVEEANRISLEFLNFVRDARKATEALASAAEGLLKAVERFKLPEEEKREETLPEESTTTTS